jgi:hypothetical protein
MRRARLKVRYLAGVAAVVSALLVSTQAPASAHAMAVSHGSDTASVNWLHRPWTVCDGENDGHYVVGYFQTANRSTYTMTNKAGAGTCAGGNPFILFAVDRFRVCEFYSSGSLVGCSDWRTVT